MSAKKQAAAAAEPLPTDIEARTLAQTGRQPRNIEETFRSVPQEDGSVAYEIGDATITVPLTGACLICKGQKRIPDPKNIHTCARCRKEKILRPGSAPRPKAA